MTLSNLDLDKLIKSITEFSEESLLNVGISPTKEGHLNLRYQYLQAQMAVLTGSQKLPKKQIHLFNDIIFDYILQQLTRALPAPMIIHEKLLHLMDSDKTKKTEYMKTLQMYLDNKCNAVQTANKLFIHRSTLIYRLDQIKEILGSDLSNPDEILYIMLSFRLLDCRKK